MANGGGFSSKCAYGMSFNGDGFVLSSMVCLLLYFYYMYEMWK